MKPSMVGVTAVVGVKVVCLALKLKLGMGDTVGNTPHYCATIESVVSIVFGSYQHIVKMTVSIRHATPSPPCPEVTELYQGTTGVNHRNNVDSIAHLYDFGLHNTAKLIIPVENRMDKYYIVR